MKKIIGMLLVVLFTTGMGFAKKEEITEIEKYQAQYQALTQKKVQLEKQYIQTVTAVEIEMIKVKAVLDYLIAQEKEER